MADPLLRWLLLRWLRWPACLVLTLWSLHCLPAPSWQLALCPPPLLQSLALNEARAIFSMRVKSWPDGSAITVFVLPDQAIEHQTFVKQVLQLLPHQLRRHWNRLIYTGIGRAPTEVGSEAEMRQQLLATPGSIGYLPTTTTTTGASTPTGECHNGLIYVSLE